MSFLDKILPFAVGHRTEFIAFGVTILKILSMVGVIPANVVAEVQSIATPLGAATFAAKVSRLVQAQ